MSDKWEKWAETATKGDLIKLIIYQRAVDNSIVSAIVNLLGDERQETIESINRYFRESEELDRVMDEIGGRVSDG